VCVCVRCLVRHYPETAASTGEREAELTRSSSNCAPDPDPDPDPVSGPDSDPVPGPAIVRVYVEGRKLYSDPGGLRPKTDTHITVRLSSYSFSSVNCMHYDLNLSARVYWLV